jgi:hypothetical protein
MGGLYSETFIEATQATGWFSFGVPMGKRAVIRSVVVTDRLAVTGHCEVHAPNAIVALVIFPGPARSVSLDMRIVVYGGESITAYVGVVGIDLLVAGYLFDDNATATNRPSPPPPDTETPPPDTVVDRFGANPGLELAA